MRESLHARLVLWYALVLTLVVAVYGGAVCYQARRSMMAALDDGLLVYARQVAAAVRPAGDGRFDVDLTPEASEYFRQDVDEAYYVIWSPGGELIDRSEPGLAADAPAPPGGRTVLGRREVSVRSPTGATVLVGRSLRDLDETASSLALNVVLSGLVTLAVSIFGGWFVAGRALAPIARISRVARAMADGDLEARIPVDRTETELEQVACAVNVAFDRLRLVIEQQRHFTADASHELRTPVSVMRAELDWVLGRERPPDQYRQSLIVCRRAVGRIQGTIEALLRTARAESVEDLDPATSVPAGSLIADVVLALEPLSHERGVTVGVTGDDFNVTGAPDQLREAVCNVVANAIEYNGAGGAVVISMRRDRGQGWIEVADTGAGIPAWAIPRVFDRFFRVDPARGRGAGGAGLGLAVARAVVSAHGGRISCSSREGSGSVFTIRLPLETRRHGGYARVTSEADTADEVNREARR
jgi:signal transduction histidine kinase